VATGLLKDWNNGGLGWKETRLQNIGKVQRFEGLRRVKEEIFEQ